MIKLDAAQLRVHEPTEAELAEVRKSRRDIYILLDDVYDTYNIGTFFRLADAVGAKKLFLCGRTECPPNPRIFKASVGTERWVDWQYQSSAVETIRQLKTQHSKLKTVAIEQSSKSIPLFQASLHLPILLVVGSETRGISAEILAECQQVIEIPMFGVNKSLNVIVAASMVLGRLI